MTSTQTSSSNTTSNADSLGKHIRWQILLVLLGFVLLATLLGVSTQNVDTVLVPDRGGIYREGVAGSPRYLNPLLCQSTEVDQDLCTLLYRGLTQIDKEGRVVPDLAERWTIENDLVYTFYLDPNQRWHDGRPVTADDVLFTIGIIQDPEVYSLPDLASLWRTVQVEKLDDYSVRFTLTEPFTPFLDYTSIGLLPAHIWSGTPASELATGPLSENPIGAGPLYVTAQTPTSIRLEPSPYHTDDQPYLSALELHFYPDRPSLFAAFTEGEIDGISQIMPGDLPAAITREDLQLFSFEQSSYLNIILNLNNPDVPFLQDPQVRQALYYGLDRERLIAEVADGQGIVADSLLLPENWAYNPDTPTYDYDPERANALLDAAGWIDSDGDGVRDKDGRPMQILLHTNDDGLNPALVEHIAGDWAQIGIRAVPSAAPFSTLVGDLLIPRRFEAALIGWEQNGDPDPYPLWHSTQSTGGGQNYSGWSNEEADEILEQARAIIDPATRKQLYGRFQEIFAEEAPALLLYYPVYTYGVSDRVYNVQIGSLNRPAERFGGFADWYMVTRRVPADQVPPSAPPAPPKTLE